MTNMDYVIVGPGPSLTEILAAVQEATHATPAGDGYLHLPGEPASLRVMQDPLEAGGAVVQVVYAADPVALRQRLAASVYDALVQATDWDLELDSDDAEDIIATRIKVER